MYKVYRNNRRITGFTFKTYEAARQFIRKCLRELMDDRHKGQPLLPMWTFGYEIRRV